MATRVSGMISGMDTESLIQQLVEVRKKKLTTAQGDQKKLSWKQDAWKELNSELKKLQGGALSALKYQSSYLKRTTKVSDSSVASVVTADNAMMVNQKLKVKSLATGAYMTGGTVSKEDGTKVTSGTTVKDLAPDLLGKTFTITKNGKTESVTIDENTTVANIVDTVKKTGLSANFDANQQRIYIGSQETGDASNFEITGDTELINALGLGSSANAIRGKDAEIELNGVSYKSSKNTFEVNGLTITALRETTDTENVTLNTEQDTSGIYDLIKNYVKEYSTLINKIQSLYSADSAKNYKMLTDEEKDEMTDDQIKEWEDKIKGSLLRKDSTLGNIYNKMKNTMASGFDVNGKKMYLSDFGINTANYLEAGEFEKFAYHIDGDEDDSTVSNKTNLLKSAIEKNPDSVVSFFTQLGSTLYDQMYELMGASEKSSAMTFYEDKALNTEYSSWTSKIEKLQSQLDDYEDSWYSKFSKMETALAKLQSKQNAIAGFFQ